jgi:hypothetical protein
MATKRFPLESGGSPRLEISHGWNFRNVIVKLDGLEIGRVPKRADLKLGRDFILPDGSTLRVQLHEQFHSKELIVTRNGTPLEGSGSHPKTIHRTAYGLLYTIAGLTAVFAIIPMLSNDEKLGGADAAVGMFIEAAIYAFLAWRVSRYSIIALYAAILLYVADGIFSLMDAKNAHGIIIRIVVLAALIRAIPVTKELRRASFLQAE